MPNYDFQCPNEDCNEIARDVFKAISEENPYCTSCKTKMEQIFDQSSVGYTGFTTPGGNGRPANLE